MRICWCQNVTESHIQLNTDEMDGGGDGVGMPATHVTADWSWQSSSQSSISFFCLGAALPVASESSGSAISTSTTLSAILVQSLVICQSFYSIIRKYLGNNVGLVLHFLTDQGRFQHWSPQWNLKAASNSEQLIEKFSFALKLSIYQRFLVVAISQIVWLIYLFGPLRLMINQRTHHQLHQSALCLKYAPSYHLFLQVQGEIADRTRAPAPLYPATPSQEIGIISTQVGVGG